LTRFPPACCCLLFWCVLQPGEDPFTLLRQEKRERVKGQQKQQLANVKQALKSSGPTSVPSTLRLAAALPTKGKGKPNKRKELRDEVSLCGGRVCWCTRLFCFATAA
jgi:regulator of ribosome biosynthesis